MYEFNSLVEFNDYGGNVEFYNSIIKNFNTCGALIRNKKKFLKPPETTPVSYQDHYQYRHNKMYKD